MIKAIANMDDGTTLLVFGLSWENLELLREGNPISINLEEMGIPRQRMLVFAGKDETALLSIMQPCISPKTHVRLHTDDSRNKA